MGASILKWCDLHFAADKRKIDDDYDDNDNEDDDYDDVHQTAYACWHKIQNMVGSLVSQNKTNCFGDC